MVRGGGGRNLILRNTGRVSGGGGWGQFKLGDTTRPGFYRLVVVINFTTHWKQLWREIQ